MTIGVLDYGVGNVGSILSMLRKLAIPAEHIQQPDQLKICSSYILPGIGAFDDVVTKFRASGFAEPLEEAVLLDKRHLLGICVGMQMLASNSEEGVQPGLGWIAGTVRHLRAVTGPSMKLPVMGWHYVDARNGSLLTAAADRSRQRYYFTHSYYFECANPEDVAAVADYGSTVTVALDRDNIWATQFHPEKSHVFGMGVMRRFAERAER